LLLLYYLAGTGAGVVFVCALDMAIARSPGGGGWRV
jgi:hypothetical protein